MNNSEARSRLSKVIDDSTNMINNATIRRIWDGFGPEGQNMPFSEFHREMQALTDPVQIKKDLADIELLKVRRRSNRIRIDRALT